MTSRTLLVGGAVSYEYLLYPMTLEDGSDDRADFHENGDVAQLVIRTGSAHLVAELLQTISPQRGIQVLRPTLQPPLHSRLKHDASLVVDLSCNGFSPDGKLTYNVERQRNIARPPVWHSPLNDQSLASSVKTVIISGSGESFKDVEPALDFLQRVRPRYIIHHMTRPLATGRLWDILRNGPMTRDGPPDPEYLAVIVDADDLRAEGIALSQSLSWEATAEDFVRNLGSKGRLDTLVTCPNLIVRFGTEGVIHHRGREAVNPKLYYSPRRVERDRELGHEARMLGCSSAFTAGFALGFVESTPPNNDRGIRYGIAAAKRLSKLGFVESSIDDSPDYPVAEIMSKLQPEKGFASVSIPSGRISSGDKWSIFDAMTGDPHEVARQIVTLGPDKALASCPIQRYGDLLTVERAEQESTRATVDVINERIHSADPQPISIGILGPMGSGKKFTTLNLAKYVAEENPMRKLTYNARLLRLDDFVAACHTIRDAAAGGELCVVIFENFEAILEPENELLNDFLAIMKDGTFTDRGHVRTLGAPLMFFLVNVEASGFERVPTPITPTTTNDFRDRKIIDESILLDGMHGIVRVAGPNQRGVDDKMFSVRRAMMLRQLLKQKHPHLEINGKINVDEAVLHSLLLIPSYKQGLRSLEKIISTSRLSGRSKYDVAALPPEEQIQLHVDGRIFMSYLRSPKLPPHLRERLAEGLFERYKQERRKMAKTEEKRKELLSDRSMYDWEDLAPELKESTRAQADDIPRKLRAVNYFMLDEDRGEPLVRVPAFTEADLDLLGEMEHERFNAERLQRQWRMGPRNSKDRTTPFVVPWRDLAQEWKDVDRVMVECVPKVLESAGWKIYRMRKDDED